jgi:hypothetical protein
VLVSTQTSSKYGNRADSQQVRSDSTVTVLDTNRNLRDELDGVCMAGYREVDVETGFGMYGLASWPCVIAASFQTVYFHLITV